MDLEIEQWLIQSEKRKEDRISGDATLFIEVKSAEPELNEPSRILSCDAVDISANGIQCNVSELLATGSIFQMVLSLPYSEIFYHLTGEVMWTKKVEAGISTGFRFFESEGTEIADWKHWISMRLVDFI